MISPDKGPLTGLRIVEMEGVGPAPFACMLLADMGAEIVTLAAPTKARKSPLLHPQSPWRRGRTRLEIDLKRPGAIDDVLPIFSLADVVVEGFRPGVMERLGLGPDRCLAANPKLVFVRITGWGQTGPLANAAGHDPNYIALTGALYSIGSAGGPPVQPMNLVGDLAAGSLYAVMGMLAALRYAERTGQGQVIDAAIVDGTASLMTGIFGSLAAGTWTEDRGANITDGGSYLTVYETSDHKHIVVASVEPQFYAALVRGLGLNINTLPPREDPANWPTLRSLFSEIIRTKTRDEWVKLLEGTDACITGVLKPSEAPRHPHNVARNTFIEVQNAVLPAPAPRFSITPTATAPPTRGKAQTMLTSWGLSREVISRLEPTAAG
jgi:alpha-methylacyl-CoA racemase